MRSLTSAFLIASSALLLTACDFKNDDGNFEGTPAGQFVAIFDPANSIIPFPSNILFSGTTDGTLNIPNPSTDPQEALNNQDGFSTVAPMSTTFNQPIDPTAANLASAVRLFEATTDVTVTAVTGIAAPLVYGVDYIAAVASTDSTGQTLSILLLRPLKPNTVYLVVITQALQTTDGQTVSPDRTYLATRIREPLIDANMQSNFAAFTDAQAKSLEPLRMLGNAQDDAMEAFEPGLPDKVALAWSFTTQSVSDTLGVLYAQTLVTDPALALAPTPVSMTPGMLANVYVGTLQVPYYLTAPSMANPTAALTEFWESATLPPPAFFPDATEMFLTRFNPVPASTETQTIPVIATVPVGATGPLPVIIYQHGITTHRATMLAFADTVATVAADDFIIIGIDLPLHGLKGDEALVGSLYSPGLAGGPLDAFSTNERTFDMDLVAQDENDAIIAQGPDMVVDSSGRHFVNLTSLRTTRDNLRQAVSDLFVLTEALHNAGLEIGGQTIDTARIHFLGMSLGGIVGTPYLALETRISDAVLDVTGGGIAKLFDGSATFGPELAAGLAAAAGITKGTTDYEAFVGAAQTLVDSSDPVNYFAGAIAVAGRGILLNEMVGGLNGALPDQVIPNNVGTLANGFADAPAGTVPGPLGGTDPLVALMDLTDISTTTAGTDLQVRLRFTAGHHASLLRPNQVEGEAPTADELTTIAVKQTAVASFFDNDGDLVIVSDSSVVQ
ncbi:MAG: Ig-like domain-containing protein [Gammaproteobacteria bacterium]|nr:Ig-like domain-containing protein [Gammaproteobacteria bacterium]